MSTELKELRERITQEVRSQLLDSINNILDAHKHLKEEPRLKVVLKEFAGKLPFFSNDLDKININDINTKEYFERTFVERVTTKFIELEKETEADQFLEYFFSIVLPELGKTYHYRYTYTDNERGEMLDKYLEAVNREFIFRCIIENIETSKAIFGAWNEDNVFIKEPDNTSHLRKFLDMEDKVEANNFSGTNDRNATEEDRFSEPSRKRQAIAFYYLLNALGVKSPESNKAAFARFLAFMSGYHTEGGAQSILNTSFYKAVKELFSGRNDGFNENDMVAVKECFEYLKPERSSPLSEALEQLKKDMEN